MPSLDQLHRAPVLFGLQAHSAPNGSAPNHNLHMTRQQIVWVTCIGLQHGAGALYADANGNPTSEVMRAAKFLTRGACQVFMDECSFGRTMYPEQVGIIIQDEVASL